jgi:HEPN domain-containing protein
MMSLAHRYIENARMIMQQARDIYAAGHLGLSIKRDQEAAEYAIKAVLQAIGRTYKREHDASSSLVQAARDGLLPDWFAREAPRLGLISMILFQVKQHSSYGQELLNIESDAIFTNKDAEFFLQYAEEVVQACDRLFAELNPA